MNYLEQIQAAYNTHLMHLFALDEQLTKQCSLTLNIDPTKQMFGDLNSNAAMVCAKHLKQNPVAIANTIMQTFSHEGVGRIEIAGPGFINLFLTSHAYTKLAQELFMQKAPFFKNNSTTPKRYNLEFVSANPTGPLHFGHGRGGIIGDVLGNILSFLGHAVTKEYYINDAGVQIKKLGESFKIRCQQVAGYDIPMIEDGYHGDYLIEFARECFAQHGQSILEKPQSFFEEYAKCNMLARIQQTLENYGITFDVWFSEKSLHDSGAIDTALKALDQKGFLYEQDEALWFKSTLFGDDKDRVIRKSSGEFTYIAADIAYMINKINRENMHLIMVLGHDHHSFAKRLQNILKALDLASKTPLDVILYQLVNIKEGGEQVRMSKRAGTMVTLDDIIETVGKDVARFFYLNRKADAQLEFDLALALSRTEENPVYYIQYAYVRTHSILTKADLEPSLHHITTQDADQIGSEEAFLIKKIVYLKELLHDIGTHYQTHTLAYYTHELAQAFSHYYAKNRILNAQTTEISRARLLLTHIVHETLGLCLKLLGINQPEKM